MCEIINQIFSDSVKISVDHQAGSNPFYTHLFDLAQYRVTSITEEHTEVLGDG
ncbi:MAG UNVERIFIED_CONTAM: hypothetical protein LVQ98_08010 [Rickettsiaceae bacterium]|jgi:hypothetical protein